MTKTYQVAAGVAVFAVKAGAGLWGRNLDAQRTSRPNTWTSDDLVEELATGYVFRLAANPKGWDRLMVPRDAVTIAA